MTATAPEPPPRAVSTAGAWLGFAVATWAWIVVAAGVALVFSVSWIPVGVVRFAEQAEEQAASSDFPPHVARLLDLLTEAWTIVRPFSRVVGLSAVLLGFALFAGGALLVFGKELGRRATRALLALNALHSAAATAWLAALVTARLADWNERWRRAHEDVAVAAQRSSLPADFAPLAARTGAVLAGATLVALVVVATLFWSAGRPSVRAWCARRGKYPVASGPRPR